MRPELMGELRSLLAAPSIDSWNQLCALLTRGGSPRREDEEVFTHYCAAHLARWPDTIPRQAPTTWIKQALRSKRWPLMMAHVTHLALGQLGRIEPHELERLGHNAHRLSAMHTLDLRRTSLSGRVVETWTDVDFPALHTLHLDLHAFPMRRLMHLSSAPWCQRVRALHILCSREQVRNVQGPRPRGLILLSTEHIEAIDAALSLASLERLEITGGIIGETSSRLLVSGVRGGALRQLSCHTCRWEPHAPLRLDALPDTLRALHLDQCAQVQLDEDAALPFADTLESLTLRLVGEYAVRGLFPRALPALRALTLDAVRLPLASLASADLPALETLDVTIYPDRARPLPLLSSPPWPRLHTLSLGAGLFFVNRWVEHPLTADEVALLLTWRWLPQLRALALPNHTITDADLATLIDGLNAGAAPALRRLDIPDHDRPDRAATLARWTPEPRP